MENVTLPRLLKLTEIGSQTGLSRSAVYREINAGRLKVVKIGRSVRVTETELSRFVKSLEL
jgi:excisionase family DNA binding protein